MHTCMRLFTIARELINILHQMRSFDLINMRRIAVGERRILLFTITSRWSGNIAHPNNGGPRITTCRKCSAAQVVRVFFPRQESLGMIFDKHSLLSPHVWMKLDYSTTVLWAILYFSILILLLQ